MTPGSGPTSNQLLYNLIIKLSKTIHLVNLSTLRVVHSNVFTLNDRPSSISYLINPRDWTLDSKVLEFDSLELQTLDFKLWRKPPTISQDSIKWLQIG